MLKGEILKKKLQWHWNDRAREYIQTEERFFCYYYNKLHPKSAHLKASKSMIYYQYQEIQKKNCKIIINSLFISWCD